MYPILLVLALNCMQVTQQIEQNQSRLLQSIPNEALTEKIIPMMDLETSRQLSETSHYLHQMTMNQMNRFKMESEAAHYQEAINVLNLDVQQFMSQFPYLAGKANCALHHTFRSKGYLLPQLYALMDRRERPRDFNESTRYLYFHVQQINASPFGEWASNVRFLGFGIVNGQITACMLLSLPFCAAFEDDPDKCREILQSAFREKQFKMHGRTWITSQHEQFRKNDLRVRIFDYLILRWPKSLLACLLLYKLVTMLPCIGIGLLAILYFQMFHTVVGTP